MKQLRISVCYYNNHYKYYLEYFWYDAEWFLKIWFGFWFWQNGEWNFLHNSPTENDKNAKYCFLF